MSIILRRFEYLIDLFCEIDVKYARNKYVRKSRGRFAAAGIGHTGGQFVFPARDQSTAIASISISQSGWASALTSTRVDAGVLEKNAWRIDPRPDMRMPSA